MSVSNVRSQPPLNATDSTEVRSQSRTVTRSGLPPRYPKKKKYVTNPGLLPRYPIKQQSATAKAQFLRNVRQSLEASSKRLDEFLNFHKEPTRAKQNKEASAEKVLVEEVNMEKRGEADIINIKCPCGGAPFEILVLDGRAYYKII